MNDLDLESRSNDGKIATEASRHCLKNSPSIRYMSCKTNICFNTHPTKSQEIGVPHVLLAAVDMEIRL